jgi:ATP-dependent Lhr-like helicase
VDDAGRWSLPRRVLVAPDSQALNDSSVDHIARVLLRRYSIVFRKLLEREQAAAGAGSSAYRRLEARSEIRGGRFVSGFSASSSRWRKRRTCCGPSRETGQDRVSISAADPLNLVGVITPGEKVPALSGNRVLFEQGVPVAVQAAGEVRFLRDVPEQSQWEMRNLLIRRQGPEAYLMGSSAVQ